MPQENDTTTQRANKGGTPSLRRVLATAAALPRAVLSLRTFFTKKEDRPLPQRTLLAAAICLPLAAICLSTVTENAFFILGEERGRGMDKAYAALRCRLSAGLGDVEAQVRLAKLYAEGHGLPRDEEKSLFWYGEAAGQGHAGAQRYLAFEAYSLTWAEMARWRQKLADQGDVRAKYLLGDMYAKGIGVPQDKTKALYWFRSAADQEYDSAQFMLGDMYAAGDGVPQDKALAAEWFRKAAEQGHGEARFRLGGMYAKGDGVPQDTKTALDWLRSAVEHGIGYEGLVYFSAQGEPKDKSRAINWLREFVKTRDRDDTRLYSDILYSGNSDMAQNMAEAVDWLRKTAEQGFVEAQYILGRMYADASEPPDTAEAIRWYRMAAEQGHHDAQVELRILLRSEGKLP